jgi:2-polyprenyl-6-methoxyphenol hydroxylase-like FAD-dependent oxidoreductase
MTNEMMIVGGGIAGPVAAMAIQKAGFEPVIYEAYGAGSDGVGAFLTLAENGLAALGVLGLGDAVRGLGMDTPKMVMVSGRGLVLAEMPMQGRTLERGALYALLRDEAIDRGIPIEYGRRLQDATIVAEGVSAQFADGTFAEGRLLVGADGVRSRTRTVIDPLAPAARHVGLLNTGGFARGLDLPGEPGTFRFVFGRRCFFGYFIHPDGDVWWFANPPARREPSREELLAVTSDEWRARLERLFADDAGPMLAIIAATEWIVPGWNTYDVPSVPRWSNDRMVIIGDAAHATSPSSGQGASMAIEDGVVLAKCLRDAPSVPAAFAAYEAARRARVEAVVKQGRRNGTGKADGPVKARIRDLVLPMIMHRLAAANALAWQTDYRIDWDAPSLQFRSAR